MALAATLRQARSQRGLSTRRLEAASGINIATIVALENGTNLAPQADTLRALGVALGMRVSDLYTVAGWLPPGELPALRFYLRAKFHDLDDSAIAELERYAEKLAARTGYRGPQNHEDEVFD